jgi:uncharacterized membrane protein YozB (DUF420 family)
MTDAQTVRSAQAANPRSHFFFSAAILMALVVFLGFLPSFYLRSQYRDTALPAYLIVHGVFMTMWMLLFLIQTGLVVRRRTDLHRRLGQFGILIAALVVVAGTNVTLKLPAVYGPMADRLPFPLEPMVVGNLFGFVAFAALVATAIAKRRDPEIHKRLIYWSCIVTIGPALTSGRAFGALILPYFPQFFPPEVALVWIAWIALLAHDWRGLRAFHPATIVCGVLLLFVLPALVDWIVRAESVIDWVHALA